MHMRQIKLNNWSSWDFLDFLIMKSFSLNTTATLTIALFTVHCVNKTRIIHRLTIIWPLSFKNFYKLHFHRNCLCECKARNSFSYFFGTSFTILLPIPTSYLRPAWWLSDLVTALRCKNCQSFNFCFIYLTQLIFKQQLIAMVLSK